MPVFDQGYRPYEGQLRNRLFRWLPITTTCFKTVKRWPFVALLVAAGIPLIVQLFMVYLASSGETSQMRGLPIAMFWSLNDRAFFELFFYEIFFAVLMMVVVGAGQIAEDFRTGALQIYFSRPITHLDYVLGKLGTVVMAGLMVTLVPAVILFMSFCAFAPDWTFLTSNPWLPLKFTAFSFVISFVLGVLVLAMSSLGRRGWMVSIAFAGAYFGSMILGKVLPRVFDRDGRWQIVHIGKALDAVGLTFFDSEKIFNRFNQSMRPRGDPEHGWMLIGAIVVVSLVILSRKIRAVEVVT